MKIGLINKNGEVRKVIDTDTGNAHRLIDRGLAKPVPDSIKIEEPKIEKKSRKKKEKIDEDNRDFSE